MKKLFFLLFLLLLYSPSGFSQSLDLILDYHFDAVNQDKYNKIQTMIIKSHYIQGDKKTPFVIYRKRPNKMRTESIVDGDRTISVYNGTTGSTFMSLRGDSLPRPMTKDELVEANFQADLDGYFFCYREKSHKLELLGEDKLDGKKVYKIKCTKANGNESVLYLDANKYLLVKIVHFLKMEDGNTAEKSVLISDYREVNGALLAFKFEIVTDKMKTVQIIDSIEIDKDIPDEMFNNALYSMEI